MDIKKEFLELKGFSRINLFTMTKCYSPYLVHQLGGLIETTQDSLVQRGVGLSEESLFSILGDIVLKLNIAKFTHRIKEHYTL